MAILKVARMGHPVLRRVALPVPEARIGEPDTQLLIDDMIETMVEYRGVGLAAPQVHVSARIVVVQQVSEDEEALEPLILVNPEIEPAGDETDIGWEGCLSIPDIRGRVPRSVWLHMRAFDRHGAPMEMEVEGFDARIIQHEVDHLDGILYLDRMEDAVSLTFLDEFARFCSTDEDE